MAASREVGESFFGGLDQVTAGDASERSKAQVKAELLAVVRDEVEDRADVLAGMTPEPTADLLEEHRGRLGGAQQQDRVAIGDVDALVEYVAGEDRADLPRPEPVDLFLALRLRVVARQRHRWESGRREPLGHELGVLDRGAEGERLHRAGVGDDLVDVLDDQPGPDVVAGVEAAELAGLVAATTPRRVDLGLVGHAEVLERGQELTVEGVPQPHVERGAAIGPLADVEAVGPLGCRGERKQHLGFEAVEHRPIRGGFGVVELVDDDHVERRRLEVVGAQRVQRLDAGEDVGTFGRLVPTDQLLAEAAVEQRFAERPAGLVEDLLAVGNEQERQLVAVLLTNSLVVEGGDDRLAGAGGGDDEVAERVVDRAGRLDRVEDLLLVRPRREREPAERT